MHACQLRRGSQCPGEQSRRDHFLSQIYKCERFAGILRLFSTGANPEVRSVSASTPRFRDRTRNVPLCLECRIRASNYCQLDALQHLPLSDRGHRQRSDRGLRRHCIICCATSSTIRLRRNPARI